MLSKINKLKIPFSRTTIVILSILFVCIFVAVPLINGSRFSEPENVLYKNLIEELVNQNVCTDISSCPTQISLYRRSGGRIYFNLYNQSNRDTAAIIGKFLVKNGIKLSNNMPITFTVYSTPKPALFDVRNLFKSDTELLKLDIEKK